MPTIEDRLKLTFKDSQSKKNTIIIVLAAMFLLAVSFFIYEKVVDSRATKAFTKQMNALKESVDSAALSTATQLALLSNQNARLTEVVSYFKEEKRRVDAELIELKRESRSSKEDYAEAKRNNDTSKIVSTADTLIGHYELVIAKHERKDIVNDSIIKTQDSLMKVKDRVIATVSDYADMLKNKFDASVVVGEGAIADAKKQRRKERNQKIGKWVERGIAVIVVGLLIAK
jgi:hypothetical protein